MTVVARDLIHFRPASMRMRLRQSVSAVTLVAVLSAQVSPAFAQIVPGDGNTTVVTAGNTTEIMGQKFGSTDVATFSAFNVGTGENVDLRLDIGSQRMVNIMTNDAAMTINGNVRSLLDTGAVGGDVYFVTPGGFVLGANGHIQAGRLTVSTPTSDFRNRLLNERNQPNLGAAFDTLYAGNEDLNTAEGQGYITILGQIEARQLSLRAGTRLVMNGNVTIAGDGTNAFNGAAAVNTGSAEQAAGVQIKDGVISLVSKGDMQLGGKIRASNAGKSAAITAKAKSINVMMDQQNAALVAGASTDSQASYVVMFAEDSVTLEKAVSLEAMGGGLVWLKADTINAALLGSTSLTSVLGGSAGGAVLLEAKDRLSLGGTYQTKGADLVAKAPIITASGLTLTTAGGDFLASGRDLSFSGSVIDTTANTASGLIAIVAEDDDMEKDFAISVQNSEAKIEITDSTLKGGALLVSAFARAGNINSELDEAAQEQLEADFLSQTFGQNGDGSDKSLSDQLTDVLGAALEAMQGGATAAGMAAQGLLPVNVPVSNVSSAVVVRNSTLDADGSWDGASASKLSGASPIIAADAAALSGVSKEGLVRDYWRLGNNAAVAGISVNLPVNWQADGGIYIQSHAENTVTLKPGGLIPIPASIGVAVMNTTSLVEITGSSQLISAKDLQAYSTASEKLEATVSAGRVAGMTFGAMVSVQDLRNQLLVDAKRIDVQGKARFAADTARSHSATLTANAGQEGFLAAALGVGISNSLTEAAVNARVDAANPAAGGLWAKDGIAVNAHTTYFANKRSVAATVALEDPLTKTFTAQEHIAAIIDGLKRGFKSIYSSPASGTPSPPPSLGVGLAADFSFFTDDTHASLGGGYHDAAGDYQTFQDGAAKTDGDIVLNAALEYRGSGILPGPTRNASAKMGDYGTLVKLKTALANLNFLPGAPQLTERELIGQQSEAIMGAISLAKLGGTTRAELGGTVSANALSVNALTDYGSPVDTVLDLVQTAIDWRDYVADVSLLDLIDSDSGATASQPIAPDLGALATSVLLSSSGVFVQAQRSQYNLNASEEDKKQDMAAGLGISGLLTANKTQAAILDGADITLSQDAKVEAREEGVMVFANNMPATSNPLGQLGATVLGGTLNLNGNHGEIAASIGAASISARDVAVNAVNDRFNGNLAYVGGGGTGMGLAAGVGVNVALKSTTALVSGDAALRLSRDLTISAKDRSINWVVAGGLTGGADTAIGAAVAVNVLDRDIRAGITPALLSGHQTVIAAGKVSISAQNDAIDIAAAIAGAAATGSNDKPAEQDDEDAMEWWVNPMIDAQQALWITELAEMQTVATEQNASQKTGMALSGAITANLLLGNKTTVEIGSGVKVNAGGDIALEAKNTAVTVGVSGAVSLGLSANQDTDAMAGSLNWTQGNRDILVKIDGDLISTGGNLSIAAGDRSTTVNVAVGGAGSSRGNKVVAGSVAGNLLLGETKIAITDAELSAEQRLAIAAVDASTQVAVGGGVGVNMKADQGFGMGLGVATNNYARDAIVAIGGASSLSADVLAINAQYDATLMAFGISAGVGKTGIAGSVAVNTVVADAKVQIEGSAAQKVALNVRSDAAISSTDSANIWALAGALSGGSKTAVGAAASVNTIVSDTQLSLRDVTFTGGTSQGTLAALRASVSSTSLIKSLAAAGAAATGGDGVAVGAGIAVNTIVANAELNTDDSRFDGIDAAEFSAQSTRKIASLSGGAAVSLGSGAGGFGLSVNTITSNDTRVALRNSTILARSLAVNARATGQIDSMAVALSASRDSAIGGSVSVNVITGTTQANITGGQMDVSDAITQSAIDRQSINVLAGNAAVGLNSAGVGVANATNIIAQTTEAVGSYDIGAQSRPDLEITATNAATIRALAATVAGGSQAAVGVSTAVDDIGNSTLAAYTGAAQHLGKVSLTADNNSAISILSGAAAAAPGTAGVGASVAIAMIHDTTKAVMAAQGLLSADAISLSATKTGKIEALAAAGAFGGTAGVAGSVVYTQIGRKSTVDGLADAYTDENGDDPSQSGLSEGEAARDGAMAELKVASKSAKSAELDQRLAQGYDLGATDLTEANLQLDTAGQFGAIDVLAKDDATIHSLAGSVAGGGSAGVGVGIAVNLMFGATQSLVQLPAGGVETAGLSVQALQSGEIKSSGIAGSGGGVAGVGAAIVVNVMKRGLLAQLRGSTATSLTTQGGDFIVAARQSGDIDSYALSAAFGGTAGVGAAFGITYAADDLRSSVSDVEVDTRSAGNMASAGAAKIEAISTLTLTSSAASAAIGGVGAVGGAVVVNVGAGNITNATTNLGITARSLEITTQGDRDMRSYAGSISGGFVGVGLATTVNHARVDVSSRHEGLIARVGQDIAINTSAAASFGGLAVGLAGGAVAVAATAVVNSSSARVKTQLLNSTARSSDLAAGGSLRLQNALRSNVSLLGGIDSKPAVSGGLAGGVLAGAGVSISVNEFDGLSQVEIEDGTALLALGHGSVPTGALRGLQVAATTDLAIDSVTANGATGLGAGSIVSATMIVADKAKVRIGDLDGDGTITERVDINAYPTDALLAELGLAAGSDADQGQSVHISAQSRADLRMDAAAFAAGLGAGGAAAWVAVLENEALVRIAGAGIGANGAVDITALTDNATQGASMGAGGGVVGAAGSVASRIFDANAQVDLAGVSIDQRQAAGRVGISATNQIVSDAMVGAAAGGAVAGVGAIHVTKTTSHAGVTLGKIQTQRLDPNSQTAISEDRNSVIIAAGDLAITAGNELSMDMAAIGGAVGALAAGVAANSLTVASSALVDIGESQNLMAGGDLIVAAYDDTQSDAKVGGMSASAIGMGLGIDIQRFSTSAQVRIGDNSQLKAGDDLRIDVRGSRDLTSEVIGGAAAGLVGISAAISSIDIAGTLVPTSDADKAAKDEAVSVIAEALGREQLTGTASQDGDNGETALAGTGSLAARDAALAKAAMVDLDGNLAADSAALTIGSGVSLVAGGDLALQANSLTDVAQTTGGAASGAFYGLVSGTGLIWSGAGASVDLGANALVQAGGDISVQALDGAVSNGISSVGYTVAASGQYAAGVGVARVESQSSARVNIGDGSSIDAQGLNARLDIAALRAVPIAAEVRNVTFGGLLGVGVAAAAIEDRGQASLRLGRSGLANSVSLIATEVALRAQNRSSQSVIAQASTGGVGVAAAGADADASDNSTVALIATGVTITGDTVSLTAQSRPSVKAQANGAAVAGGVAVGVSVAQARSTTQLQTSFDGSISANDITIDTLYGSEDGTALIQAKSTASAGGLVGGAGAEAKALGDYTVLSSVKGSLSAIDDIALSTRARGVTIEAIGSGKAGGLIAAGAVNALAGQSAQGLGRVESLVGAKERDDLWAAGRNLTLSVLNAPAYAVDVTAGAKGLGVGAAAYGETRAALKTLSTLGDGALELALLGGQVAVNTTTDAAFSSQIDSTTASVVGQSGAAQKTTISVDQRLDVMDKTLIRGMTAFDMLSYVGLSRTAGAAGANIKAGSGGLAGGSAVTSKISMDVANTLRIRSGAMLDLYGSTALDGVLSLAALNSFKVSDLAYLDASGAIAVPRAEVDIIVNRGDAKVEIEAASLSSGEGLRVSAGNEVDIHAKVDASTTGVAGAAAGRTLAAFTGEHGVKIGTGATLFAEQDIELLAGYKRGEQQHFALNAETRLYNRTALPIETDPEADAIANDTARVEVDAGAKLLAVRDITLAAQGGARDIRGFGLGKDLYREVLAELASVISDVFGGGPVSLDIKSGTTTDNADNGIVVNGTLRAGLRNIQVLYFDADNNPHYGAYQDDEYAHAQTTVEVGKGTSNTIAMEKRLAQVKAWMASPEFASNSVAQLAWQGEVARLEAMIIKARGTANLEQISVGDIRASAGNINLRADYLKGAGDLTAPGSALIDIQADGAVVLDLGTLVIDNHEGGKISFNGVEVNSTAMIRNLSDSRSDGLLVTLNSAETVPDKPEINISTDTADGIVMLSGDVMNLGGTVKAASSKVLVYGDVRAVSAELSAREDVSMEYRPGVRSTSGANPEDSYAAYFKANEAAIRKTVRAGTLNSAHTFYAGTSGIGTFIPVSGSQSAGISASSSITISADMVNVNSYLRAGVASYDITIGAGVDAILDRIGGTATVLLYDPLTGKTYDQALKGQITSNAALYYDPLTKRILVADLVAMGGNIEITGDIFSTGNGRLEVLDGFGALKLNSQATHDIQLGRVYIGGELDQNGQPQRAVGKITLNDFTYNADGSQTLNTTTYTRNEGDARTATYTTKQGRDYVYTNITQTSTDRKYLEKQLILVGGSIDKGKSSTEVTYESTPVVSDRVSAPYLAQSLSGQSYEYAVVGTLLEASTTNIKARHETHNSVEWYKAGSGWIHNEWTDRFTTVEQFEHRVKADKAIEIAFSGQDLMGGSLTSINVNAAGSVIFGGQVVNYGGLTSVASSAGSILSGGKSIELAVADTSLSAAQGSIGSTAQAINMVQAEGSFVTATAKNGISLAAPRGDLAVGMITATGHDAISPTAGAVSLVSRGDLIQKSGSVITGGDISLTSQTGTLGSTTRAIEIATKGAGRLQASATGLVNIAQATGDIRVREVVSHLGDVQLSARAGSILDGNDDVLQDFRSADELVDMWRNQLGLTDRNSQRFQSLIASYQDERARLYAEYWQAREADGQAQRRYELDAETQSALQAAGLTASEIEAYRAERDAFWAGLASESAQQANYAYTASQAEIDGLAETALYDEDALLRGISSSFVRQTTSTVTANEAANVKAYGSITLNAAVDVGRNADDYVIDMTKPITTEDIRKLSGALANDIDTSTPGLVRIRQFDDLNIAQSGVDAQSGLIGHLRAQAGNNIYLGSASGMRLDAINGGGSVMLRAEGSIFDGRAVMGQPLITAGGDVILQSASGALGQAGTRLSLRHGLTGSANLRAASGMWIDADGDLVLSEVYSPATVDLAASGAIRDAYSEAVARIVAGDITLTAESIGTSAQALGVNLLSPAGVISLLTRQGSADLRIFGDASLGQIDLAVSGHVLADGDLVVNGPVTVADDLTIAADGALEGQGLITAAAIDLQAASIGAQGQALHLTQTTGSTGVIRAASTTGDLHLQLTGPARLEQFAAAASGSLAAGGLLQLSGADVIRFGAADSLRLDLAQGIDLAGASGTDIAGGRLQMTTAGQAGNSQRALTTAIAQLDLQGQGADVAIAQSGDLELGRVTTDGAMQLDVAGTLSGATGEALHLQARDLRLSADAIGAAGALIKLDQLAGGSLSVTTRLGGFHGDLAGDARLNALHLAQGGELRAAGKLALTGQDTIRFGSDHSLRLALGDLDLSASSGSDIQGGSLDISSTGDLGQADKRLILDLGRLQGSTVGDIHVTAAGDLALGALKAGRVLDLVTLGDLSVEGSQSASQLVLSAGRHLAMSAQPMQADLMQLFAFGGDIRGTDGGDLRLSGMGGGEISLFAQGAIAVQSNDALRLRYAAAGGDLRLTTAGLLQADALGAGGQMLLQGRDISVGVIGSGRVRLADAQALGLIGDGRYGEWALAMPTNLRAQAAGSLDVDLLQANNLTLEGTVISATLMAGAGAGEIRAAVSGANGQLAQSVTLSTVVHQNAGLLSGAAFLPQSGARDGTRLHLSSLAAQDATLIHSGGDVEIDALSLGGSILVTRGNEIVRVNRGFAGINPAVQLDLWTKGDASLRFVMRQGQVVEAAPVSAIDMRRTGYQLNGAELLSEDTMTGMAASLARPPQQAGRSVQDFLPRGLQGLQPNLSRTPWIFGTRGQASGDDAKENEDEEETAAARTN